MKINYVTPQQKITGVKTVWLQIVIILINEAHVLVWTSVSARKVGIRKHYISVIKHNKLIKPQHNREGSPMESPTGTIPRGSPRKLLAPRNFELFLLLFFKATRDLRRYDLILSYEKKLLVRPATRNYCP